MATKRKPPTGGVSQNARLKYMAGNEKGEAKGTKPTIDPTSIKEIMTLMILFACKKFVFYNTNRRIALYLGALFIISLVADVGNIPKSYLSRSDNIFNQCFVKYAWGWNVIITLPYVLLTSYIYCCGHRDKMIKHHLVRIGIATFFWWFWTNAFNYIENTYGKCNVKDFANKQACLKAGNFWNGFDISGHSFILIYGSLMLIEETRSVVNWDSIKDYLRLEDHYRTTRDTSHNTNPLRSLSKEEFTILQNNYDKYTPYIRGAFILITLFNILWDFMLLCTILYYHVMIEKLLGGAFAVATWFITYRVWYPSNYLPKLPGNGVFKYMKAKVNPIPAANNRPRRTGSIVNGSQPMFMGRPIYPNRTDDQDNEDATR